MDSYQRASRAEQLDDLFERDLTKLILSTLIIVSVLPFGIVERFSMVLFAIFAIELALRVIVIQDKLKKGEANRAELLILVLDFLAVLSFLPLEHVIETIDLSYLRLIRLFRMLLLVSYWHGIVADVWTILTRREQRYQLAFVATIALMLALIAATLLSHPFFARIDFNEDGNPANESFLTILWWAFRQLQDPGNMLRDPAPTLAFALSVTLTLSGLFVLSFLIGIGTSVVEQLVKISRERPVGMREHAVIGNVGPHSRVLVDELTHYFRKSLRSPRILALGSAEERYDYMHEEQLRKIRYRQGSPGSAYDLERADAVRANRIILLGDPQEPNSDSEVIAQVLSVRAINDRAWVFAELFQAENVAAARRAGGPRTIAMLPNRLVSMLIANLALVPEARPVYEQLLTSLGEEIYTCVYGLGALANTPAPSAQLPEFGALRRYAQQHYGIILLGYLLEGSRPDGLEHVLNPASDDVPPPTKLRGFFGVSPNFDRLREFVEDLPGVDTPTPLKLPALELSLSERRSERVLICGFDDGTPELCEQILLRTDGAEIGLLAPDQTRANELFDALKQRFVLDADDRNPMAFRCRIREADQAGGRLTIGVGDWARESTLANPPAFGHPLSAIDTVIFTDTKGDDDPDARTSLGLLKLLELEQRLGTGDAPSPLRVMCAIRDGRRADLLEARFGQSKNPSSPVTIIATERTRHAIVAQGIFVPAITGLYDDLLSCQGQSLQRLTPKESTPNQPVDFGQLIDQLPRRSGFVPIAVELVGDAGPQLLINPKIGKPGYRFDSHSLIAIYAVGPMETDE